MANKINKQMDLLHPSACSGRVQPAGLLPSPWAACACLRAALGLLPEPPQELGRLPVAG